MLEISNIITKQLYASFNCNQFCNQTVNFGNKIMVGLNLNSTFIVFKQISTIILLKYNV